MDAYYILQFINRNIYVALHCEGELEHIDIKEFANVKNLQGFSASKQAGRTAIFKIFLTNFEDISPIANTMKNLIESTYPTIKKSTFQEDE